MSYEREDHEARMNRQPKARATDPPTSHKAVPPPPVRGTARWNLLCAYRFAQANGLPGLIPYEAFQECERRGIKKGVKEYATRVSELLRGGLVELTGVERTSPETGKLRYECRITDAGLAHLRQRPGS